MVFPAFGAHSVSRVILHVVWATVDRRPTIDQALDEPLERVLRGLAWERGAGVRAFGAACDHVHVLVQLPAILTVAAAVQRMKGASSHALHESLLGGWQAGYWAESVSPDEIGPVSLYVRSQRAHHASARSVEPWEMEPADRRA